MKFSTALFWALAIHFLLASGLAVYLSSRAPEDDIHVTLDLASVELSLSDQINETAAPALAHLSTPATHAPTPRETEPLEQNDHARIADAPPEMEMPELHEKMEDPPALDLPPEETSRAEDTSNASDASAASAPLHARLDAPPALKKPIKPKYPKGAQKRGEEGSVVLLIHVDARGRATHVDIVESSGFSELDHAAKEAALAALFTPAKTNERAIAASARLTLTFRLKESSRY